MPPKTVDENMKQEAFHEKEKSQEIIYKIEMCIMCLEY